MVSADTAAKENKAEFPLNERAFEIKILKIELILRLNSQREFYFITTIMINCLIEWIVLSWQLTNLIGQTM